MNISLLIKRYIFYLLPRHFVRADSMLQGAGMDTMSSWHGAVCAPPSGRRIRVRHRAMNGITGSQPL